MQTIVSTSSNQYLGLSPGMVAVICITVFICLLMALYLLKKLQDRKNAEKLSLEEKVNEARSQELEWYREKRFLMERQAREKQARLEALIISVAPENTHRLTHPATRLFYLAESIREERQHLGTDISKLSLIDRRLRKLGKECINQTAKGAKTENWLSRMSMCRQMIQSNHEDLRKSQNLLRNILGEIVNLEEKARNNEISKSEMSDVIKSLENTKGKLSELPDGLRTVAKTTGEKAQALFEESTRHIPNEDLHVIWKEQTSLDLFSSKHRPGGKSDLLEAAERAISALHSSSVNQDGFSAFWEFKSEQGIESSSTEEKTKTIANYDLGPESKELGDDLLADLIGYPEGEEIEIDIEPEEEISTTASETGDEGGEASGVVSTHSEIKETDENIGYEFDKSSLPTLFEFPEKAQKATEPSEGYQFKTRGEVKSEPQIKPEEGDDSLDTETENKELTNEEPAEKVWATPVDFGLDASTMNKEKFKFNPFGPVTETAKAGAASLAIFRSDNPEIWNTSSNEGEDSLSIALNEVTGVVKWIGIKRIDTGEEVFSEITLDDLKSSGEGKASGFNGSNEYFYGARHLGFFSEECATEVETRFTYGGWGFGHLATSEGEIEEQICGWNGQRIPNGTVFEFTLYEERPERAKDDQIVY